MQACSDGPELSYEQLMARWGFFVDGEERTIAFLLRILRTHAGYSQVYQRCSFGMGEADFRRLQRMRRPRADHFVEDVQKIALACKITNIRSFVAAMEQAHSLLEHD